MVKNPLHRIRGIEMKNRENTAAFYRKYCTGCGLCQSILKCSLEKDEKGFPVSNGDGIQFTSFCSTVCPAGGLQCSEMSHVQEWGHYKEVCLASAADKDIRYRGSTGGILTALAIFLLEEKMVDGIIQVRVSESSPLETQTVCSKTAEEVLLCSGSRYTSSAPLSNIDKYLCNGRWAFIGKPCDVTALHNYSKTDPRVRKHILYLLSFFCAGTPSEKSNHVLLEKMGTCAQDCAVLRYRGEGWPGSTIAVNKKGEQFKVDYQTSWRETLGRDIRLICRYCLDGVGELADLSCGDAWYINDKGEPIFPDTDGRNVVFIRSEAGKQLMELAEKKGYIRKSMYENCDRELPLAQKFQFERKYHLWSTFMGLRCMGREYPRYSNEILKAFNQKSAPGVRLRRFLGTIKRMLQNKI